MNATVITGNKFYHAPRYIYIYFFLALRPNAGHGLFILDVSRSNTTTHHSRQDSSGRVISSSQRDLYLTTHDIHNRQHPCRRWDSNPRSLAGGSTIYTTYIYIYIYIQGVSKRMARIQIIISNNENVLQLKNKLQTVNPQATNVIYIYIWSTHS